MIPVTSFSSISTFESFWVRSSVFQTEIHSVTVGLLVPLGLRSQWKCVSWCLKFSIHIHFILGARMVGNSTDHSHINVASSTLSLIATPTSNPSPPTSTANPNPAIHYASGAIHAKSQITVTSANSYTISGDFSSPTVRGAWPAFCTIIYCSIFSFFTLILLS